MKEERYIMIIDDDTIFAALLRKCLAKYTKDAVHVYSSTIEIIHTPLTAPYLVFIDYHMNDLNGLSTARLVRKKWGKKVVIILISASDKILKIPISKYGIDKCISKKIGLDAIAQDGLKMYKSVKTRRTVKKILVIVLLLSTFIFLAIKLIPFFQ